MFTRIRFHGIVDFCQKFLDFKIYGSPKTSRDIIYASLFLVYFILKNKVRDMIWTTILDATYMIPLVFNFGFRQQKEKVTNKQIKKRGQMVKRYYRRCILSSCSYVGLRYSYQFRIQISLFINVKYPDILITPTRIFLFGPIYIYMYAAPHWSRVT